MALKVCLLRQCSCPGRKYHGAVVGKGVMTIGVTPGPEGEVGFGAFWVAVGGLPWGKRGTYSFCPTRTVVEFPRQFAHCN